MPVLQGVFMTRRGTGLATAMAVFAETSFRRQSRLGLLPVSV
jgi:hypothetical protein